MLPPLLETLRRNVGRGFPDVALFEIGLVARPESLDAVAPQPDTSARPDEAQLAALDEARAAAAPAGRHRPGRDAGTRRAGRGPGAPPTGPTP